MIVFQKLYSKEYMFNFILDKLRKLFYFENAENYIPTEPDNIDSELREFTRMCMKFHREVLSEYSKLTEADQARLAIDDNNGTISSKITTKISEEFWDDDRTIDKLIGWVIVNGTASITGLARKASGFSPRSERLIY
jgi:hypothetical protein